MIPQANLQVIFAVKLRQFRKAKGFSINALGREAKLAPSYITELEQGQRFPSLNKIRDLAEALAVSYEALVSPRLEQNPYGEFLDDSFLQYFPFGQLGQPESMISVKDAIEMFTSATGKLGTAFAQSLVEMTKTHAADPRRHRHAALLRALQASQSNHFADLEEKVQEFTQRYPGLKSPIDYQQLKTILANDFGYQVVEDISFDDEYKMLGNYRVLYIQQDPAIVLNPKLTPAQKAFALGRELGYNELQVKERHVTTPAPHISASFPELWNSFQASYFSGALLINRDLLQEKVRHFFQADVCNASELAEIREFFQVTDEMLFHRLTEILPKCFGIRHVHFLRFDRVPVPSDPANPRVLLTKYLNMDSLPRLYDEDLHEHHCRRWVSIKSLGGGNSPVHDQPVPPIQVQRSYFLSTPDQWLCFTAVRPRFLGREHRTSITIGFKVDEEVKQAVRFWADPHIASREVGYSCERCPLPEAGVGKCEERAVPRIPNEGDDDPDRRVQEAEAIDALTEAIRTRRLRQQDATPRRATKGRRTATRRAAASGNGRR